MRIGSLFSGGAGLDMAALQVFPGSEVVWHCEINPAASKVLAHHFPGVPNLGDITLVDWGTVESVDVLIGGFPCTDVSAAGRRAGLGAGTRSGLWAYMRDAVEALDPEFVLVENVGGLLSAHALRNMESAPDHLGDSATGPPLRAIGAVLGDMADAGFDAEWCVLRASQMGFAHQRARVFILAFPADSNEPGSQGSRQPAGTDSVGPSAQGGRRPAPGCGDQDVADADGGAVRQQPECESGRGGPSEPGRADEDLADAGRHGCEGDAEPDGEPDGGLTASRRGDADGRGDGPAPGVTLLPTPSVADGTGGHVSRSGARKGELLLAGIAKGLGDGSLLLPGTVDAEAGGKFLPTPRAGDGPKGSPNQRGSAGDLMLAPAVLQLLPTPRTTDANGAGPHGDGGMDLRTAVTDPLLPTPTARLGHPNSRGASHPDRRKELEPKRAGESDEVASHVIATAWGPYESAIRRQEAITRPAPAPTELNKLGNPRLAAVFAEWLMGWPDGWVTDPAIGLSRNEQLTIVGNGVVVDQAVAAFRYLFTLRVVA